MHSVDGGGVRRQPVGENAQHHPEAASDPKPCTLGIVVAAEQVQGRQHVGRAHDRARIDALTGPRRHTAATDRIGAVAGAYDTTELLESSYERPRQRTAAT